MPYETFFNLNVGAFLATATRDRRSSATASAGAGGEWTTPGPLISLYFLTVSILEEAQMITSRLTSKAQTTIPQPVRVALRLEAGDELVYVIEGDRVMLTKAQPVPVQDPFGTFGEWHSAADRRAYGDL